MQRLQFMSAGMSRCAVPASIHCDHLIQAVQGAESDLQVRVHFPHVSALPLTRLL